MKRRGLLGQYQFYRYLPDVYGEPGEREEGAAAVGYFSELLHRDNPYVPRDTGVAGTVNTRCTPMLLIPGGEEPGIAPGDRTEAAGVTYEVTHVRAVLGVYHLVSLRAAGAEV